jgi:predicted secreted hydrolase
MKNVGLILLALTVQSVCAATELRTEAGFRIPAAHTVFEFPRDHGSHPEYRIEWWYITGHLRDNEARRFGFQATFFRYALNTNTTAQGAAFGTNQMYMAHMALTDVDGKRFMHEERLNREGWDASARTDDLDLKNGNWSLRRTEGETMMLSAGIQTEAQFRFVLEPAQPLVVFGKDGLSRKGAEPSACSWYLTFPRLRVSGELEYNDRSVAVTGEAWMDHEISSSQLGREQVGWDWLSVRLDDGSALMVYILRDAEGRPDPHSTLAWIDQDGRLHHMGPADFSWSSSGEWTSPETGITYPIDVRLRGTRPDGSPFDFTVRPLLRPQELDGRLGGIAYWEGACDVLDQSGRVGEGYMELTGYQDSLGDRLR